MYHLNCRAVVRGMHRGRKGIFNYFSKFSKLIFDLSCLIDQTESENLHFFSIMTISGSV